MTYTQDDREKKQYLLKYRAEKITNNGIVLRDNCTARVRRLDGNRHFLRGVFDGDGKGRRQ